MPEGMGRKLAADYQRAEKRLIVRPMSQDENRRKFALVGDASTKTVHQGWCVDAGPAFMQGNLVEPLIPVDLLLENFGWVRCGRCCGGIR